MNEEGNLEILLSEVSSLCAGPRPSVSDVFQAPPHPEVFQTCMWENIGLGIEAVGWASSPDAVPFISVSSVLPPRQ